MSSCFCERGVSHLPLCYISQKAVYDASSHCTTVFTRGIFSLHVLCSSTGSVLLVRGTYTGAQVDSIISTHALPPLSSWRGSVQFTSNGGRVPQWFYVEQYRKSDTVELVHVVEQRGSLYQYVCRAVLRGRNLE